MTTTPSINNPTRKKNSKSGMALVLVLSILVLITLLVVFINISVRRDLEESSSFAAFTTAQQLADSAMDIAIGQIREATSGFEKDSAGNPLLNQPLAWASQPGAIRTYKKNGDEHLIYKLYSTRRLVTQNAGELTTGGTNSDIPTDWATRRALFTDLNAPATNRQGLVTYPIADPQSAGIQTEGFSYTGAPTANTTNPLPMPAQWIYVLADGTLTSPTVSMSTGDIAGWSGSGPFTPSATNPIIGRIAFWTDDETSKININTASDGNYWDTPRANTTTERNFANFQPAQNEFQRYPGHPATTSLAPVFFFNGTNTPPLSNTQHNAMLQLIPRIVGGGSNRGTAIATAPLVPDNDRIYANLDEMIYGMTPTGVRQAQPAAAGINRNKLEQTRFFLTAHSKAPETNLFNGPRVALWPVDVQPANRTAIDRLIAFCASLGGAPFYFQRLDAKSQTYDFYNIPRNQQLYAYLRRLTDNTFPGFGTNYCLTPDNDSANTSWKLTAPRHNSFADKYGVPNRDSLLTQIFDYIRCTNTDDTNHLPDTSTRRYGNRNRLYGTPTLGMSQVVPIKIGPPHTSIETKGHGRFPTISEAGFHFICTADANVVTTPASNQLANKTLCGTLLTPGQRRIEAMFYFEGFSPSQGYPNCNPSYAVRVRGLQNFAVNGIPLQMPNDAVTILDKNVFYIYHARAWSGSHTHRVHLHDARLPARGCMPADAGINDLTRYPFVSAPITITLPLPAETMLFSGGTVTLEIYARTNANSPYFNPATDLVQTIELEFPQATFPAPRLVTVGTPTHTYVTPNIPATTPDQWWTFSRNGAINSTGRIEFVWDAPGPEGGQLRGALIRDAFDVVRSMVPPHADYRILSAMPQVPANYFVPHPNYFNTNQRMAHNISEGRGGGIIPGFNSIPNPLITAPAYGSPVSPDVPIPHNNSTLGDWDTGIAQAPDGPYINKPDEGNQFRATNLATQIPYFVNNESYVQTNNTFFSSMRQIPSAFMLGSLSTGVNTNTPYRTLLFRPETRRDASGNMHFGLRVPRDHLLADLFWMPVVEPYAISEPLSTAGKINMNYRIAPYNYIRRATGLHALLMSERVAAIPAANTTNYKMGTILNNDFRLPINQAATLSQFDKVFDSGAIFRSPTEIADLHIVPQGTTLASVESSTGFWQTHSLTGDNLREKIYTTLLPRLTTKSNTYTVHFRVQALKQRTNSPNFAQWDNTRDTVLAEYRGAATIERYLDPNQPGLPDFANMNPVSMTADYNIDRYYRFRVISTRKFAP